jgi:hypothetical protein
LTPRFKVSGEDAVQAFQAFGSYEPLVWVPDSVRLVRSKLGRGGSEYTLIEEFPLGPPDGTISEPEPESEETNDTAATEEADESSELDDVETSAAGSDSSE